VKFAPILLSLALLAGCSQKPSPSNPSAVNNGGVDIVPQAVLASLKMPPDSQPAPVDQADLLQVLSNSQQSHQKTLLALRRSGLDAMLQTAGPWTLLAPTDAAWDKLPPGTLDRLLQPANQHRLVSLLQFHLLNGEISLAEMVRTNGSLATLAGPKVLVNGIDGKVMVNDANVVHSETACNGVIHWIDGVLIPTD
jgi:uncharacterized surface protein with fasciclin (FAS1) repeats